MELTIAPKFKSMLSTAPPQMNAQTFSTPPDTSRFKTNPLSRKQLGRLLVQTVDVSRRLVDKRRDLLLRDRQIFLRLEKDRLQLA